MIKGSNRLDTVKEYYFSKKLREVASLIKSGKPIINMGIGSPDLFPSKTVINILKNSLSDLNSHRYQSYQGLPELREAISKFYLKFFKVKSSPVDEILPLMGSKEGIMHISMAFLNKGDEVLIPNPGYPTYLTVTNLVEATPVFYDLKKENNWFPDVVELQKKDLKKVKIMWINYPHMPTGSSATKKQLSELIKFSVKNNILLINDNPYSFILNDDFISLLTINKAKENCMELNSLSKSFNLSGWRVGMLLGSKENILRVLKVKSNMDSGMFIGVQQGAIAALKMKPDWFESLNKIYKKRKNLMEDLAGKFGATVENKSVGLFLWAKLPEGSPDAETFIDNILYQKNIFITPGTIFGSQGEGYIRFSLCVSEESIKEAIKRMES